VPGFISGEVKGAGAVEPRKFIVQLPLVPSVLTFAMENPVSKPLVFVIKGKSKFVLWIGPEVVEAK